jgi:hypothetical protein
MSGRFWKWLHFWGIFVVIGVWILAVPTGWIQSVVFVSHVSMAALVLAEISSWQGSRTEQKQDKQLEDNQEQDDRQDKQIGGC